MFVRNRHWVSFSSSRLAKGFSLIELMAVIAISSILLAMAAPAISSWIDSARAKAVRQQFYALASEARSIALKESQTITICHLIDQKCQPEFAVPLSLFADNNRNAILDEDERLIRVMHMELPDKISISWNRSSYMRFWPSGGTGALTGSLSYCDAQSPDNDFRIVIARTGRLRIDETETRCG